MFKNKVLKLIIIIAFSGMLNEEVGDNIPNQINLNATLGVNMNFDKQGAFSYIISKCNKELGR